MTFTKKNDGQRQRRISYNILLQRIGGIAEPKDFPEGVFDCFTAIAGNLEQAIAICLGEKKNEIFDEIAANFGIDHSDLCKSPAAISSLFAIAKAQGCAFELFDEIIKKIDAMGPIAAGTKIEALIT